MSDELHRVDDPNELFLAVGAEVNPNRPLYTGDTFSDVTVPVLGGGPLTVAIISHPCAMRRGHVLEPLLHIAPVVDHAGTGPKLWTGHFRFMSLDGIPGFTGQAVQLDQMTLIDSSLLDRHHRIACLSRPGVNVLRQRLINQMTRVVIHLPVLDREAAPGHEEVDLMEEWVDQRADVGISIAEAEKEFDTWLSQEGRRGDLGDPAALSQLRRSARRAAVRWRDVW